MPTGRPCGSTIGYMRCSPRFRMCIASVTGRSADSRSTSRVITSSTRVAEAGHQPDLASCGRTRPNYGRSATTRCQPKPAPHSASPTVDQPRFQTANLTRLYTFDWLIRPVEMIDGSLVDGPRLLRTSTLERRQAWRRETGAAIATGLGHSGYDVGKVRIGDLISGGRP